MTGEELRRRRLALGVPPARFALLLGENPGTYYYWERGMSPVPEWVEEKLAEIEATRWPRRSSSMRLMIERAAAERQSDVPLR